MTMNLSTTYLDLTLRSPLVVSASPLSDCVDNIKCMEDAGAGAVVLYSLFEEQVRREQQIKNFSQVHPTATQADVQALFPAPPFRAGLDDYLEHIGNIKKAVNIPIIASLNCTSLGSWTAFATQVEQAGADALELNIYFIPTDPDMTADQAEEQYVRILKAVKTQIRIPVAIKLCPFFTNMAHMARRLDEAGADALVLFNRFYGPDFDPRTLKVEQNSLLSSAQDSRLPLHWIAILYGRVRADLAATGGIYTAEDVVKMLMVGAKVTMMTSALLKGGIGYLRTVSVDLDQWLDENGYNSISELQGLTSQFNSRDPGTFERSEYMRSITAYRPIA